MDDVKNIKHAEELLVQSTKDDCIVVKINNRIETWNLQQYNDSILEAFVKLKKSYVTLFETIFEEHDNINSPALHWLVFNRIYDIFMPCYKKRYYEEDLFFFEKSKALSKIDISAEQLGGNENYAIRLSAAIVELSVLDLFKSPIEKMNCLCSTYDLVFAELKTAMVMAISKNPDKDNEIPVLNNEDIIPLLMVVIIKSKLVYLYSNLLYIQHLYYKLEENRIEHTIFQAFETAINNLRKVDEMCLKPSVCSVKQSIDLYEFVRLTSNEDKTDNQTLPGQELERILHLITVSTEDEND